LGQPVVTIEPAAASHQRRPIIKGMGNYKTNCNWETAAASCIGILQCDAY